MLRGDLEEQEKALNVTSQGIFPGNTYFLPRNHRSDHLYRAAHCAPATLARNRRSLPAPGSPPHDGHSCVAKPKVSPNRPQIAAYVSAKSRSTLSETPEPLLAGVLHIYERNLVDEANCEALHTNYERFIKRRGKWRSSSSCSGLSYVTTIRT